jgi:hypothetical protein
MITKIFRTYVSPRELWPFLGEVHYSLEKLTFPWGTIMSQGRKNLSWPRKKFKPFFLGEQSCL